MSRDNNQAAKNPGAADFFPFLEKIETADLPFRNPDLPLEERIDNLLEVMTPGERESFFNAGGHYLPRLDFGFTGQVEGYHGAALWSPADWCDWPGTPTTQFCQAIGMAATWDPELVRQAAEAEAVEFRYAYHKLYKGGLVVRAPNADMGRDIRWGRNEECYGEDPFLNGEFTVAFVKGLQGDHPRYLRTAALLKHFLANSNENNRSSSSSDFDERLFREYYTVAFRKGFQEGGADCFMAAYNAYNGIPCHVHPVLQEVTVKEGWVDGIICTDGGGLGLLVTDHKHYATLGEATAACLKTGINQYLDSHFGQGLKEAKEEGLLTDTDITRAVRGVLRIMFRLGLFDPPGLVPYTDVGSEEPWLTEKHRQLVRRVTRASIVLLKNRDGLLPLQEKQLKRIAVIGHLADTVHYDWYSGRPPYHITPLAGIRARAGGNTEVVYAADNRDNAAVKLAESADAVVLFLGNHPTCYDKGWAVSPFKSEGKEAVDRETITLEPYAQELADLVLAANPRTIIVLIAGFPYAIGSLQERAAAILHMTHNSQETGSCLAEVLFGDYNPAGRLVQTWPRSLDDLPDMQDYDIRKGRTYLYFKGEPLYSFGFGLSYTTFTYLSLRISAAVVSAGETLAVTVQVKNSGSLPGEEVVQMYVKHLTSAVERPLRELKGFRRVLILPGETLEVTLPLAADEIRYWDPTRRGWVLESGTLCIMAGGSSAETALGLRETVQVVGENEAGNRGAARS